MSKAPIWAVAAAGTRNGRLTREQLAAAALEIADRDGFDSLSMRRVADALGVGTMTLYYYVRTKDDLLALVEDALMGETVALCAPLPKAWRAAVTKVAVSRRTSYLRHPWSLRALTGVLLGPNGLRHIEQSLSAVSSLSIPIARKLELLSFVDDFVVGHCSSEIRSRTRSTLDRKTAKAVSAAISQTLASGSFPHVQALIGSRDPAAALAAHASSTSSDAAFVVGLDALLDGLTTRFKLK